MLVRIPTLLRSYTAGVPVVELPSDIATAPQPVSAALDALDGRFPGLRFRIVDEQGSIRPHIKIFADGVLVRDLRATSGAIRELMIVGALSGG